MNCTDNEMKINKLLDGELNKEEYMEVFQHLASCHQCRIFFHQMEGLKDSLENLDQIFMELPHKVVPLPAHRSLRHFWRQKISVRAPIIVGGALLIIAVVILFYARPKPSETIYVGRLATVFVTADSSITK